MKECRMNMTFICLVEKKNERTNHLTMLPKYENNMYIFLTFFFLILVDARKMGDFFFFFFKGKKNDS